MSLEERLEQLSDPDGVGPVIPDRKRHPPIGSFKPLPVDKDVMAQARVAANGRLVVGKPGAERTLTIDRGLQSALTDILKSYETPYAAVVALEPATGRVLAMAEHAAAQPGARGLATRAVFPAASIFKIVTAAALLQEGLTPETTACFHGGKRRLSEKLLVDSERDSRCVSLATAMGKSANVVFAKLTQKHLSASKLRQFADRFRFNQVLDFPVPTDISLAALPDDPFDLASTGAGFGDVYLSPLHGALVASVAANKGLWRDAVLFEDQVPVPTDGAAAGARRVMSPEHAAMLTEMLEETVTAGTARRIFRERGYRVPGAVGKTGTLADRKPFRDYSWFVGFAPKDNPAVAVAAVVVNEPKWRIRATYLGREGLRLGLLATEKPKQEKPKATPPPPSPQPVSESTPP